LWPGFLSCISTVTASLDWVELDSKRPTREAIKSHESTILELRSSMVMSWCDDTASLVETSHSPLLCEVHNLVQGNMHASHCCCAALHGNNVID